ncbi:MAG TPA: hypothetical protein VNE16_10520 [Vicinamibacterales bacterium]|nr:hypothetical protein [Vicinamibacterales bacterium]
MRARSIDDDRPGPLPLIQVEHDDVVFEFTIAGSSVEGLLRIRCSADGSATASIGATPGSAWAEKLRRFRRDAIELARSALAAMTGGRSDRHAPASSRTPAAGREQPGRKR